MHKYKCPVFVLEYTRERVNHHACDSRNDFDQIKLQDDLNTLLKWQDDWQMHFNADKCFVMHLTHARNPKTCQYSFSFPP